MANLGSSNIWERRKKTEEYDMLYPISQASKDADDSVNHLMDCLEFGQTTLPVLLGQKLT